MARTRKDKEIFDIDEALATYNKAVNETATVLYSASRKDGKMGERGASLLLCSQFRLIQLNGPDEARNNLRYILVHMIHTRLFESIWTPFYAGLASKHDEVLTMLNDVLLRHCDDARVHVQWKEWTCEALHHMLLERQTSMPFFYRTGHPAQDGIFYDEEGICDLLTDFLLWTGLEKDHENAHGTVKKAKKPLTSAIVQLREIKYAHTMGSQGKSSKELMLEQSNGLVVSLKRSREANTHHPLRKWHKNIKSAFKRSAHVHG